MTHLGCFQANFNNRFCFPHCFLDNPTRVKQNHAMVNSSGTTDYQEPGPPKYSKQWPVSQMRGVWAIMLGDHQLRNTTKWSQDLSGGTVGRVVWGPGKAGVNKGVETSSSSEVPTSSMVASSSLTGAPISCREPGWCHVPIMEPGTGVLVRDQRSLICRLHGVQRAFIWVFNIRILESLLETWAKHVRVVDSKAPG